MSRIVTHNETVSAYPSSYDSTYQAYSVSGLEQGQTNSNSTNYATINTTRGNGAVTSVYYNFSFNIPTNAVISSVTAYAKCYISSTQQNRFTTRTVQLYAGTTAKGSSSTVSNSTNRFSMTPGTWTASELNNAKIRIYAVRGTNNTSTNYYFRFYGADITVNYSWDETFYEFTFNSSVQGVGMTSGETTSGGSYTATITGITDITKVVIKDNGTDVTSTFTKSGNNYVKTYSNVNADHTITIEEAKTKGIYLKMANTFVESTNFYKRGTSAWSLIDYTAIYCKVNGNWITGHTMTGKTAMFFDRTYVLDDCVVNFDGIDSYNNRYEDTTSGFEGDIVYPFGMSGNFMRDVDVVADGKSFEFNGTTSYMRPSASASFDSFLYNTHTIEICFEPYSINDGEALTMYVGRGSRSTIAMYMYRTGSNMYFIRSSTTSTKMLVTSVLSANQIHYIAANNDGWLLDGVYYSDSELNTSTNSLSTNDIVMVSGQYTCASIGMRFKEGRDAQAFTGKIYALRIHSTKLTENDMRKNMSCDFSRFS